MRAWSRPALGQVGVWTSVRQWPSDRRAAGEIAAELEQLGFSTVWLGGGPGGSSGQFNVADALLAATTTLVVATGIVEVWSTPASESSHATTSSSPRIPGVSCSVWEPVMLKRSSPSRDSSM